jgi:hypothetical protein
MDYTENSFPFNFLIKKSVQTKEREIRNMYVNPIQRHTDVSKQNTYKSNRLHDVAERKKNSAT